MFVGPHGAFAQPENLSVLVVQRDGVRACGLDGRAYLFTNGIEIHERTFRSAKGVALLHRSN
jgi:hypothetical protein